MSESDPNARFEERSKALFDESVDSLNGNVRSRLTQARQRALAEADSRRISRRVWLPAAGLATAAAVTALIVVPHIRNERVGAEAFASADDMAILLNNDDLEMIEDIEFYAWLDSNPDDANDESSDGDNDARS